MTDREREMDYLERRLVALETERRRWKAGTLVGLVLLLLLLLGGGLTLAGIGTYFSPRMRHRLEAEMLEAEYRQAQAEADYQRMLAEKAQQEAEKKGEAVKD